MISQNTFNCVEEPVKVIVVKEAEVSVSIIFLFCPQFVAIVGKNVLIPCSFCCVKIYFSCSRFLAPKQYIKSCFLWFHTGIVQMLLRHFVNQMFIFGVSLQDWLLIWLHMWLKILESYYFLLCLCSPPPFTGDI